MSTYDELTKICKNIIRKNNPDTAIMLISTLRFPVSNELIGSKGAVKIFKIYSDCSVGYNSKKYDNNFRSYNTKINKNFRKVNKLL